MLGEWLDHRKELIESVSFWRDADSSFSWKREAQKYITC
jgi:hypothetical protein